MLPLLSSLPLPSDRRALSDLCSCGGMRVLLVLRALFGNGSSRTLRDIRCALRPVGDPVNIEIIPGRGLITLCVEQNYHVGVIVIIAIALLEELLETEIHDEVRAKRV